MPTYSDPRPSESGTPPRSLIQRQEALKQANYIRTFRKKLKKDLKSGHAQTYEYILDPPDAICTMKILDLLLATPKVGRVKAQRLLIQCRISPSKTICGLSDRQRTELASMLRH